MVAIMMEQKKNRIKELIDERGWTIWKLKNAVRDVLPEGQEIPYATIYKLTKAEHIPARTYHSTLVVIARALGVTIDDLEK